MKKWCIAISVLCALSSCHHLDDDRIPPAAVRIAFNTQGEWNTYGVGGAGQFRYFIKSEQIPAGFPYTALSYTGFGGVLLICDVHGNPVAYDMSCPVECRQDVRIAVDETRTVAECPKCHSTYDVVTNYGHPLSGEAAEKGYGLQRYYVAPGPAGEYFVITR